MMIFSTHYSFDYTKNRYEKPQRNWAKFTTNHDNTVSYSEFRDKLLKAGYGENNRDLK